MLTQASETNREVAHRLTIGLVAVGLFGSAGGLLGGWVIAAAIRRSLLLTEKRLHTTAEQLDRAAKRNGRVDPASGMLQITDPVTGTLRMTFGTTHLQEMLRLGRSRVDVTVRTLMMVDSLDMTDGDRELIVRSCVQCPESRIVITHGTDTMVETARALAAGVQGKTMVLTGAMIPWAFGSSDGLFNLGSALSFAQVLPHGVYIAMNGQHFSWNTVRKNRETGVFESLA